jgi:hypothetical protein
MIRRELPLTISASQVEPVANVRRGFSFVLAPAAADPVFELDNIVHCLNRSCFSLFGKLLLLSVRFLSCCHLLRAGCFSLNPDGPDKTQQFASYRGDDLPLLFAYHGHLHVALVQAVLRFPRNLLDFCRHTFLALA